MKAVERVITPSPYTVPRLILSESELHELELTIAEALHYKGIVLESARLVISGTADQGNGSKSRGGLQEIELELPSSQHERADRIWNNGVQEVDA